MDVFKLFLVSFWWYKWDGINWVFRCFFIVIGLEECSVFWDN